MNELESCIVYGRSKHEHIALMVSDFPLVRYYRIAFYLYLWAITAIFIGVLIHTQSSVLVYVITWTKRRTASWCIISALRVAPDVLTYQHSLYHYSLATFIVAPSGSNTLYAIYNHTLRDLRLIPSS